MMRPAEYVWRPGEGTLHDQRGVALIIVLVVVALLTITVTEFSYSVQIDRHRVRNSFHAMQSSLLARSGVNLAEGFLLLDDNNRLDSYTESWWLDLVEFCREIDLGPSMKMRCRVWDESGKINVNNTITRLGRRRLETQEVTSDAVLRDAIRCLFQSRGIDVDIVDKLVDYWMQDPPEGQPAVREFTSLENFAATFGIPTRELRRLRSVLTAKPRSLLPRVNINTAPAEVLAAILNAEQGGEGGCPSVPAVDEIIEVQHQEPEGVFQSRGAIASRVPSLNDLENVTHKLALFDVRSSLYRLEASALANVDPLAEGGSGIGQTLSVLVWRQPNLGRRRADGTHGFTLRRIDWQKEGGARLFRSARDDDEDLFGELDEGSDQL